MTAWVFRTPTCQCGNGADSSTPPAGDSSASRRDSTKSPLIIGSFTENNLSNCHECGVTYQGSDHTCADATRPTTFERSLIGTTINQKYKIEGFVGRGGMSVVYRSRHVLMGNDVALKLLRVSDPHSTQRFQIEAKAVSSLTHKNIIKMFEFGLTEEDTPFLAVEYLSGSPLSELINGYGSIAQEVALGWFSQIAHALKEAHTHGIIHRDLKPSNVMVGTDNEGGESVKILDFGIAKVILEGTEQSKLTQTGEVFGSPMYMSPEQCVGGSIDNRSDIYSFGTLMYETLSGTPPILGENVLDTIRKQISESPPPLRERSPEVSENLEYIVMRCIEKDPDLRYQSIDEVLTDITLEKARKKIRKAKKQSAYEMTEDQKARVGQHTTLVAWVAACFVAIACGSFTAWLLRPTHESTPLVSEELQKQEQTYKKRLAMVDRYEKDGDFLNAVYLLQTCTKSAEDRRDDVEAYRCWRRMGDCHAKLNQDATSAACYRNAFYVYKKLGLKDNEFLRSVVRAHRKAGVWYKHIDEQMKSLPLPDKLKEEMKVLPEPTQK